jgi:hypothetical protein
LNPTAFPPGPNDEEQDLLKLPNGPERLTMQPSSVDLTIPLEGLDPTHLLAEWRWLVPQDFEPIQLSKFSDWFFCSPDGRIHRLELTQGSLLQVAKSRAQFEAMQNDEQMRNDWFQAGLVLRCAAAGLTLKPGECYGWRVHPMLGGKLEVENIQAFPVITYQGQTAQLLRQQKNLVAVGDLVQPVAASPPNEPIPDRPPAPIKMPKSPKKKTKATRPRQGPPKKSQQRE